MPQILDPQIIADFNRDGAVVIRGAFAPHLVELLSAGVERNLRKPGPFGKRYTPEGKPGMFFGDYCSWQRIAEYEAFLRHSPAAAIAGALMQNGKVNLFHEHVLVKEPGTEEPTPWHQTSPIGRLRAGRCVPFGYHLTPWCGRMALNMWRGRIGAANGSSRSASPIVLTILPTIRAFCRYRTLRVIEVITRCWAGICSRAIASLSMG